MCCGHCLHISKRTHRSECLVMLMMPMMLLLSTREAEQRPSGSRCCPRMPLCGCPDCSASRNNFAVQSCDINIPDSLSSAMM